MKKLFLSLMFVALSAMTFAQQWTSISKNAPTGPEVKLISSSEQKIVVDFTLSGFSLAKVSTPNGIQQVVSVPKMASMLEAGAPDLPHFPIPAIIGDMAEMNVSVSSSEYIDYENVEIAPSKGNLNRQVNPDDVPYTYGAMYSQNAFYPVAQATLETPYIIRDFRGQNIMVAPFAYNPVTKTLRVYHHLIITMNKVSDNGVNVKAARKSAAKMSPEMKAAYNSRFINFNQNSTRYNFVEDRGEMLVICPEQYMEAMQRFVDWKNQSGRPTTMVSVTEAGGNSDTQIKNYISSIYNDPEHNLEFILLVGDYNDITPHSMSGGRSDNWFGQLEGSDYYIEAFTGRFSVQSVTDVETHVEKVLYYERDIKGDVDWLNKGIGIGANEGAGQGHMGGEADYVHINYIRDTLMHYTYETVSQQYSGVGGGTSAAAISADVNNGASIINYCNHGSQTSWAVANYSNSHVNALVNDDMWPYIWSVACNNGEFNGTCFGEAWLRATNNTTGRPTGAIGGMFSWISQPWTPPMTGQDEMVDILTEWKSSDQYNHTFGGASLNGNMYILDMHPSDQGATHNTWILFGDPTLMVRTDNPATMNLSCSPNVLMLGMGELAVNAQNTEYGIATLMMDGEVLCTSYIQDGACTLNFPPMANVGTATLTVMGYNKVTEVMGIEVLPAEGAYLTIDSYSPGTAVYNEETPFSISFKNVGVDATTGTTTVNLSCDDERLHIISGTAELATLAPNATVTLENAFTILAEDGIENGTRFQVNITMENGGHTWEGKAFVTVQAPVLSVGDITTPDLQPGSNTGYISFRLSNTGDAAAENAIFEVTSSSPDIQLENNYIVVEHLDAGESMDVSFNLTVAESVELGSTFEINYLLTATHYSCQGSYILTVGNIVESFESGDFSMYNWTFNGSANWTVVNNEAHTGTYSAKSGVINNNQQTELVLTIDILASGQVSFYKKVSSEGSYDKLIFLIDGAERDNWSGEVSWSQATYNVTAGIHTFTWRYSKDVTMSSGSDCAWIDDIQFPPTSVVLSLAPVTNLQAVVDGTEVSLTWDGVEAATYYVIRRNGEEIATLTETYYEDVVEPGTYTYSIVAKDDEGHCSSAAFVTVDTTPYDIEENETELAVYPNPVSNTLNINCGNAEFSYMMFNDMGQMVANGNAHGATQISVSGMAKGVYFLRLISGTQVRVEKVVVK